ncbi:DEXDc helicase [Bodo saltans virus]|uniref:DEXDc helicase n=1 Tax=Bodo saltans virus TaxID=2024608 RepID=A0A2H4UTZ5_9VIRU|nr:DEXDc helicase [Bodo saltans virus]ATZ80413.1 DEXDc helicase [Bodo saltans virus]
MESLNMENDATYLLFDKYASGHRGYNNKMTKDITVDTLFSSDYIYLQGMKAFNLFKVQNPLIEIPINLLNHDGLYDFYYFTYTDGGVEYRFSILSIDNKKLSDILLNNKPIPENKFLMDACNYNNLYNEGGVKLVDATTKLNNITNNIKKIVDTAILPNADPTDPIQHQPDFAKLQLFEYQKKTIKWMLTKEIERETMCIEKGEIKFGKIVYNTNKRKFMNDTTRQVIEFYGGGLIDEVGLGKTCQMLCTSLLNPLKELDYLNDGVDILRSKATLIICPNQLVGQWTREITNVINESSNIKAIPMYTKIHFDKYTYKDIFEADFVITSFNFLANQCFLNQFLPKISKVKSYFSNDTTYSYNDTNKVLNEMHAELKKNIKTEISSKNPCILLPHWRRVVIDEFHELFTVDKYEYMKNIMKHFKGEYKWCLTGTPFDKSDTCLLGMFDFITNYIYNDVVHPTVKSAREDLLLNDELVKYLTKRFFRRNTKSSVIEENKLLPLKEQIVWLDFTNTEHMMYNAYLANPNVDKFNVTLRQLCCHPKIANEIKSTIENCKSLDEIEKTMLKFYENAVMNAEKRMMIVKYRIQCLLRKLEIAEWKQYAKVLHQLGYRIKFELNDTKDIEYEKKMNDLIKSLNDVDNIPTFYDYDDILKDDDENDASIMKKPLIVVSNKNKDNIILMTQKSIGDKTVERYNIEEAIEEAKKKEATIVNEFKGKKLTYDYYLDVMNKLKKTSTVESVEDSDSDSDDEKEKCGVCIGNITGNDLGMTKCGHIFCYNCIKPFVVSKGKCPTCQKVAKESDIFMVIKNKPKDETIEEFKGKNNLIQKVGTKLANLIFFLKKNNKHCIIFSQWDDLLHRVGDILNEYGIQNVFCKGNVWQRDKAIREFNSDDKIRVIMLSSESAASGTNLTKAEMVILLDPVYGTYEYRRNTEWQAIGRAYRTGQTKEVTVVRFIVKNTVEEEIYNMNKKNDIAEKKVDKFVDKICETTADTIELEDVEIKELQSNAVKNKKVIKPRKTKKDEIDFNEE